MKISISNVRYFHRTPVSPEDFGVLMQGKKEKNQCGAEPVAIRALPISVLHLTIDRQCTSLLRTSRAGSRLAALTPD